MNGLKMIAVVGLVMVAGAAWGQPSIQWQYHYNRERSTNDCCTDFIKTRDGGYALAGYTEMTDIRNNDYWLVKTNANGQVLWSRMYGGAQNDVCIKVIETSDAGFFLVGNTESFGGGIWLLKTDANGDSLSSILLERRYYDTVYDVIQLPDHSLLLATSKSIRLGDAWTDLIMLRKINEYGDVVQTWSYDLGNFVPGKTLLRLSDGGFALAGMTSGNNYGRLLRLDDHCDSLWFRYFDREYSGFLLGIVEITRGEVMMAGWDYAEPNRTIAWLKTFSTVDDTIGSKSFGDSFNNFTFTSLIRTADGGIAILGLSGGRRNGGLVMRATSEGDSLWTMVFGSQSIRFSKLIQNNDFSYTIACSNSNNFYLVKTTPDPVSVRDPSPFTPSTLFLSPAYPNPFNSTTSIPFSIAKPGRYAVDVVDISGRLVERISDRWRAAGSYSESWDAAGVPAGGYVIRLQAGVEVGVTGVQVVK